MNKDQKKEAKQNEKKFNQEFKDSLKDSQETFLRDLDTHVFQNVFCCKAACRF